ncbi:hypothetical protein HYC85_003138 [Camellia sinensis]|uniref:Uncharacterized protein n=1 Tax=Camellia sinensis TaxID=4442 RepID=A0A7J7IAH9_CAMSI|nr:hypothetical protein HYC85_003138 [Camellia sinensis]
MITTTLLSLLAQAAIHRTSGHLGHMSGQSPKAYCQSSACLEHFGSKPLVTLHDFHSLATARFQPGNGALSSTVVVVTFRIGWLLLCPKPCCPEFWSSARAGLLALEQDLQILSTFYVCKSAGGVFFMLERHFLRSSGWALERPSLSSSGSTCYMSGSIQMENVYVPENEASMWQWLFGKSMTSIVLLNTNSSDEFVGIVAPSLAKILSATKTAGTKDSPLERGNVRSSGQAIWNVFLHFALGALPLDPAVALPQTRQKALPLNLHELTGQLDPRHNQRNGNLESISITNFSEKAQFGLDSHLNTHSLTEIKATIDRKSSSDHVVGGGDDVVLATAAPPHFCRTEKSPINRKKSPRLGDRDSVSSAVIDIMTKDLYDKIEFLDVDAKKCNSMIFGGCNSTIVECLADDGGEEKEEFLIELGTTRRFPVYNQQQISYKGLQKPTICNTKIYGDCIGRANKDGRPCTTYN